MQLSRRHWLGAVASLAFAVSAGRTALTAIAGEAPTALPFTFDWLVGEAEQLAKAEYKVPEPVSSPWLSGLNYDQYRDIRFDGKKALWRDKKTPFQLEFFHLGALVTLPVQIHEVVKGQATRLTYDPSLFDFAKLEVPPDAMKEVKDYAGFRLHTPLNKSSYFDEFLVFLGASYFRAVGKDQKYGLSARGLAVNTASPRGEEFPLFRSFWIERPTTGSKSVTIYALLDSPSIAGAYRFIVTPGVSTRMEVQSRLFVRKDIERLGIAPLTSMFEFGENDRRITHDFRPEVHDSDGLLFHNGTGEWVWRPLLNPLQLGVSSYGVDNAKGFGLLQRDRSFTSYEDLEAHYQSRPSLWVEPKGEWGKGAVQLVEIPTDSEIHDNIVAYWVPEAPVTAGQKLSFDYALDWGNGPKGAGRPAAVLATWVGRQFDHDRTKFVIDFEGHSQRYQSQDQFPQLDVWTSAGTVSGTAISPNPNTGGWRVSFDLTPEAQTTHELRCILKRNGRAVSETWSFQWRPE